MACGKFSISDAWYRYWLGVLDRSLDLSELQFLQLKDGLMFALHQIIVISAGGN